MLPVNVNVLPLFPASRQWASASDSECKGTFIVAWNGCTNIHNVVHAMARAHHAGPITAWNRQRPRFPEEFER